jgi:uncharacterized membrane protein
MAVHRASVVVRAPAEQVYAMWTHFEDFPKFMHFVLEVTYLDETHTHWVVDAVGRHEWDAENENWIVNRQVGWRSTDGLDNSGRVTFTPQDPDKTLIEAVIAYDPPYGFVGDVADILGAGKRFERDLHRDLLNFARMVGEAPPGAYDPLSSNYLFQSGSAAAQGRTDD